MRMQWNLVPLDSLGVLRARGAEVVAFLQGQLSNDVARLAPERALFAGYHNPQGRAIALLRLVLLAPDDVLAVLPRELVPVVASRLGKFILRAKVKLQDESPDWKLEGVLAPDADSAAADAHAARLPLLPGGVRRVQSSSIIRIGQSRLLVLSPADAAPALEELSPATVREWQLSAIAAGEPQVYAATSEEFVAQMLNLDVLEGIAFDKGCYTGQEVIARAHYRGRIKRRMQRFGSTQRLALQPGDAGQLSDGRSFKIVEAAQHPDGRCEFLAVSALETRDESPAATSEGGSAKSVINATELKLPYALPQ